MDGKDCEQTDSQLINAEIAELPEACLQKIHDFERELNKEGYWNIALIAYQMKQ